MSSGCSFCFRSMAHPLMQSIKLHDIQIVRIGAMTIVQLKMGWSHVSCPLVSYRSFSTAIPAEVHSAQPRVFSHGSIFPQWKWYHQNHHRAGREKVSVSRNNNPTQHVGVPRISPTTIQHSGLRCQKHIVHTCKEIKKHLSFQLQKHRGLLRFS